MSASGPRAAYVAHLQTIYELGVKERENDLASYDLYLGLMRPGLSVASLVDDVLARRPQARVLDIGCGDAGALHSLVLAHPGRVEAHGIDLVVPATAPGTVRCVAGDALRVPFPADCDLIVSFRALHEIGQIDSLVPKVARALARGGRGFLSIRVAEFVEGRVEPQGSITPRDVQWLRTAAAAATVAGVRLTAIEVSGAATARLALEPGAAAKEHTFEYVRGVNVFLERLR